MNRGRFIALEGGEGVGKSTQLEALGSALRERGIDLVITREPGGSDGAEAIRAMVLTQVPKDGWTAEAEALLFAAARADHVARVIRPALAKGQWVLSDRFVDSSRAYQGVAGGLGDAAVVALHEFGSHGLRPDRTLILHMPTDEGLDRAKHRDGEEIDAIGGRDQTYHAKVVAGFEAIAAADPIGIRLIDASGTPEQVTVRLLDVLSDLFP